MREGNEWKLAISCLSTPYLWCYCKYLSFTSHRIQWDLSSESIIIEKGIAQYRYLTL